MGNQDQAYQLRITFGNDMLDEGFTAVPNLFLLNYRDLGLSDGQAMWVVHILRFKWSEKDPYPSQEKLPMRSNSDTRRKHARTLRNKGLLFTRRRYYTPEDVAELGIAPDQVGKLQSLEYDFASLFHNVVRMQCWKAGRRPVKQFEIEIPGEMATKVARGYYQDTPPPIQLLCEKHTVAQGRAGRSNEPLLLCEKHIVEAEDELAQGATLRKTHSSQPELLCEKRIVEAENEPEGGATVRKTHSSQPELLCEKRIVETENEPEGDATVRKTHSSQPELLCDFQVVEKRIGNNTQHNRNTHSVVVAAVAAAATTDLTFDQQAYQALLEIGFTPPSQAQQYAAAHPSETILAWCEAVKGPGYVGLSNPAGLVRARLDEGIAPLITTLDGQAAQATAEDESNGSNAPGSQAAQATPPNGQAAQANVGNDVDGAGDWAARLRAAMADKTAGKRRQWTGILVQMCEDTFGPQPDGSPRRLGHLLKQAGGDLDAALLVAQAISQAGGQNGPPLDEVERLVGQAGRQLGSSQVAGEGDLLPNNAPAANGGAFPWPSILEWYGYLANKLPPRLRQLSPGDEAVLALRVAEVETHRGALPPGAPGSDVGGDGWVAAGLQEMVTCQVQQFTAPLVYLQRILERWMCEGYRSDGRGAPDSGSRKSSLDGYRTRCSKCQTSRYFTELCDECGSCLHGCCSCTRDEEPAPTALHTAQPNIWQVALSELQLQMTRETFNTWFKPTRMIECEGDTFIIGVENDYVKEWLGNRLLKTIKRTLASLAGKDEDELEVEFVVLPGKDER